MPLRHVEHQFADQRRQHAVGCDRALEAFGDEDFGRNLHRHRSAQLGLAGQPLVRPALCRRQHALFVGLRLAAALAGDRHPAEPAGAAAAAGGRDADAGVMQHAKKAIAACSLDDLAFVDGNQNHFLRHEAALGEHQADRHDDDETDDDAAANADFDHAATISAKAENPSDIMPARMKVMPRPLSPPGRSA